MKVKQLMIMLRGLEDFELKDCGITSEILCALDAQPEQKPGKWLPHPHHREWNVCSVCGTGTKMREYGQNPDGSEWVTEYSYPFCPWCGHKMELS